MSMRALGQILRSLMRDVLCATAWAYAVTKIFFFDIDQMVVAAVAPEWAWLLNLRILPILTVLLLAVTIMGRKRFVISVAYLLGFLFIVVFWKIPRKLMMIGNWVLTLSVLNVFLSLFTDIPYRLTYFIVFAVSSIIIITNDEPSIIVVGMVGLGLCVLSSYAKAIVDAFRGPQGADPIQDDIRQHRQEKGSITN